MSIYTSKTKKVNVIQGDYAVCQDDNTVLITILGSCVATCLYDPILNVGGMNHFLLPGDKDFAGHESNSYGLNAMELLINSLLKMGANRGRLQAKIFGGASMIKGLSCIGAANAKFAKEFLAYEGIPCLSEDLGGDMARRLRFWPTSGRVQMRQLENPPETIPVKRAKPIAKASSDLELF
jgi:chemotaxis protein CheD